MKAGCHVMLAVLAAARAAQADWIDEVAIAAHALPPHSPDRIGGRFGPVQRLENLPYTASGSSQQTLDLYLAPSNPPRPLVVYIHGGGWRDGDARHAGAFVDFPEVLARLAAEGYAVASLNYRTSHTATYPAALDDVRDALLWLRTHAGDYGLDPQRIALWGSSSGAHLAAWAALNPPPAQRPGVRVLVSWFGVFDLTSLDAEPGYPAIAAAARKWLGCPDDGCTHEQLAEASVRPGQAALPSVLLLHGDADRVVPMAQSQALATALGGAASTAWLAGVGHSFVGAALPQTAEANRRALEITLAFLHAHL